MEATTQPTEPQQLPTCLLLLNTGESVLGSTYNVDLSWFDDLIRNILYNPHHLNPINDNFVRLAKII